MKKILSKVGLTTTFRIVLAFLVFGGGAIFILTGGGGKKEPPTVRVERGSVVSSVSVTGTVKPTRIIDLAFTQSGRLSYLGVSVGEKVLEGEMLAHLDNSDLSAQVAQADADVKVKQAKLDSLLKGARPEDLAAQKAALAKTESDLNSYYAGGINVLNDAYAKANDAVYNQISAFFVNGDSDNPQLVFNNNSQAAIDAGVSRVLARYALISWGNELTALAASSTPDTVYAGIEKGQAHLNVIRTLLNQLADVLSSGVGLSQSSVNSYRTSLNTALTNINTASTNIVNQRQLIDGQKATVAQAQSQYDLLLAGSTKEDIEAQQAQVEQSKAQAQYARAQLEKTTVRAPFDGTVAKLPYHQGDLATGNSPVVSILGTGTYQIEANIAESDVSRIRVDETASVTLDAYGPRVVFDAKVAQIDLSSTILEGVATYKTLLTFAKDDPRILPGLTANVEIFSERRDGVLYVPTRDIIQESDGSYLNIYSPANKSAQKTPVTVGLTGSDGRTEILSGVSEGELMVSE